MPAELRVPEVLLAERAGVPRERLRQVRQQVLAECDWGLVKGRVVLTVWGAKKALSALGVPDREVIFREALASLKKEPAARCELVVCGQMGNPRVVRAMLDGVVGTVILRVPRAENFTPGMRVPGCVRIRPGVWDFVGRCPRWRGKW